jgi:hypothetical protein
VDNTIDLATIRYYTFCGFVRQLNERFGGYITSWWRSPAHNATLAGEVADSEHQTGTAIDYNFDAATVVVPGYFIRWCAERGVEAQKEADHWHLQLRPTLP